MFATDAAGELHVLDHDGDALGVDGAEVGVLKYADEVGLTGLLKGEDGEALKAHVLDIESEGGTAYEALKRGLANEEVRGLLVLANFAEGDGARPETVRLLDGLGSELL